MAEQRNVRAVAQEGYPSELARLRRRLLAWYDRNRRALPWRTQVPDPYATLVAEIMLQQTQVSTVVPYYERFLARFPTVEALAAAELAKVLPYWAGLGYYRRCHNLHAAARRIVGEHGGVVPGDVARLASLPGVGLYTAGAIASIAYGQPVPAVDGNARRVLARWVGTDPQDRSPSALKGLQALAAQWISRRRPGDFNQALMELGARVCTPRQPRCSVCPLRANCAVAAGNARPRLPRKPRRPPPAELVLVTVAVQHGERMFYRRRPDHGLWSGLWEWPTEGLYAGEEPEHLARCLVSAIAPGNRRPVRAFLAMTHILSHRRVTFYAFHVTVPRTRNGDRSGRWLSTNPGPEWPMSRAQTRLLAALRSEHGHRGSDTSA